jgi:putative transposase
MRESFEEYRTMDARVLYSTLHRVGTTYENFFRRQKELKKQGLPLVNSKGKLIGFPKLRQMGDFTTIPYEKSGWKLDQENKIVSLTRGREVIGKLKLLMDIPVQGTIKTMSITRSKTNKWWVQFSVENAPTIDAPQTNKEVGIDFGVHVLCADSDGKAWANPRFIKEFENKKIVWDQKIAALDKFDPKRPKYLRAKNRLDERLANKRKQTAREIAAYYTNNYDTVYLEGVEVTKISKKAKTEDLNEQHTRTVDQRINKVTLDAGMGQIRQSIINAAVRREGKVTVKVNPAYTSQTCHKCGSRNSAMADVGERMFYCPVCDLKMDRDINAALNVLARGKRSLQEKLAA